MSVATLTTPNGKLFLGKKDARPYESDRISYSTDIRPKLVSSGALPANLAQKIASAFGHGGDFANWGGHANMPSTDGSIPSNYAAAQGCGDCGEAAFANKVEEDAGNTGAAVPKISDMMSVKWYMTVSVAQGGPVYDPQTGANDNGSDLQTVLNIAKTDGFPDDAGTAHGILDDFTLEPGNWEHMLEVAYLMESVYPGFQLQQAQEDQYSASKTPVWDYVAGSPIIGGHCALIVGKALISWMLRIGYTQNFVQKLMDEGYGILSPAMFKKVTGKDAEGYNQADAEQFFSILAAQKTQAFGALA